LVRGPAYSSTATGAKYLTFMLDQFYRPVIVVQPQSFNASFDQGPGRLDQVLRQSAALVLPVPASSEFNATDRNKCHSKKD